MKVIVPFELRSLLTELRFRAHSCALSTLYTQNPTRESLSPAEYFLRANILPFGNDTIRRGPKASPPELNEIWEAAIDVFKQMNPGCKDATIAFDGTSIIPCLSRYQNKVLGLVDKTLDWKLCKLALEIDDFFDHVDFIKEVTTMILQSTKGKAHVPFCFVYKKMNSDDVKATLNKLIPQLQEKGIKIKAISSDGEHSTSAASSSVPWFVDCLHILKCVRNGFFKNFMLVQNALVCIEFLRQYAKVPSNKMSLAQHLITIYPGKFVFLGFQYFLLLVLVYSFKISIIVFFLTL